MQRLVAIVTGSDVIRNNQSEFRFFFFYFLNSTTTSGSIINSNKLLRSLSSLFVCFFSFSFFPSPQESHKAAANLQKQHIIYDQKESVLTPRHLLCLEYWCSWGVLVYFFSAEGPLASSSTVSPSYPEFQWDKTVRRNWFHFPAWRVEVGQSSLILWRWRTSRGFRLTGNNGAQGDQFPQSNVNILPSLSLLAPSLPKVSSNKPD